MCPATISLCLHILFCFHKGLTIILLCFFCAFIRKFLRWVFRFSRGCCLTLRYISWKPETETVAHNNYVENKQNQKDAKIAKARRSGGNYAIKKTIQNERRIIVRTYAGLSGGKSG